MALNQNLKVALAPGTTLTRVEGKDVLFSTRTGESYGLNEMAAQMLRLLLDSDADTAARQVAAEYDAPQDDIAADLRELVTDLERSRLVRVSR